jgi:hypothetical protein
MNRDGGVIKAECPQRISKPEHTGLKSDPGCRAARVARLKGLSR